jgi:hypothetical protein
MWRADIIYIWDLWGQRFRHNWTYSGDPTVFQVMCPEMFVRTGGVRLVDELLGILTNPGLKLGCTLRPQRFHVQASGPLPTDPNIKVLIRLDQPWGRQFWHRESWGDRGGTRWYMATPDYVNHFQQETYSVATMEAELRRKLDFLKANYPQFKHAYIDTTVNPDGLPIGSGTTGSANVWARLKADYPDWVFSQEQQASPNDEPYSAPYGEVKAGEVGPPSIAYDQYADAQHMITVANTPDWWSFVKPQLVENVARGRTKLGGLYSWGPGELTGDFERVQEVLAAAATWVDPGPSAHTTIPTNTTEGWTIESLVGSGHEPHGGGSIVGGNTLRLTNPPRTWETRAIRRLGELEIGVTRRLQFTLAAYGTQARVYLRDPFKVVVYNSGPVNGGTFSVDFVPTHKAYYLVFENTSNHGSVELSAASFAAVPIRSPR